jgi:lysophospholipase L1-like esterase
MRKKKLNILLLCSIALLCLEQKTIATNTQPGTPGDKNIRYFGRWDFSDPAHFASYWGGAYFKVNFTGTSIKLVVGNKSNFYSKIDNGPWMSHLNAKDTINLTPAALTNGTHTLVVAQGKDYDYIFKFDGLILDPGAKTEKPEVSKKIIEYIGDSITSGYTDAQAEVSDYGWMAAEDLGTEHTQIAYPGIDLLTLPKFGNGMELQYFKARSSKFPDSPDWDFKVYTPAVIIINLGTNDSNKHLPDSLFQRVYTELLTKLRAKFPKAQIFAMRTFLDLETAPTIAAVKARNTAGDDRVHYIDTNGWLGARKSDDYTDGLHPSISGHRKVARLLEQILAPYLR